ncbi:MAG: DUF2326 domain-containing protein [Methylococcaceae bacterium]
MIHAVRCSNPSFNTVYFKQGFNIVLADKTSQSSIKDSRNGLGKSLLIEIIHFCLGSSKKTGIGLFRKDVFQQVKDWTFILDFELEGKVISASRQMANPKIIDINNGEKQFSESDWTNFLGMKMFGLPAKTNTYSPSFRSLISYFIRRDDYAFSHPFEYYPKQLESIKQVNNAFLLGLADNYASEWQEIKDKKKLLGQLKKAAKSGLINGILGSLGELESERIRLQAEIEKNRQQLDSFQVHPQYKDIEQKANTLTKEIHQLSNANMSDRQILDLYKETINTEQAQEPTFESIEQLYKEASVILAEGIARQLSDLQQFHVQLIENRKQFLSEEIKVITQKIQEREQVIIVKTNKRAELLKILQTHRALEEHTRLEERHIEKLSRFKDITQRIDNLKRFEAGSSELLITQEQLASKAKRDYEERASQREQAINLFNANSEALYDASGSLVIDIDDKNGYRFGVDIKRTGSTGIEKMKVFCYDLMLIQRWQQQVYSPHILIHDSALFDGVDERQVDLALQLMVKESEKNGFQYICTLNTDQIPHLLSENFNLEAYCVLRLTDDTPENSLLGLRF